MITIKQKYNNAKRCAKDRNIDWQFTLESWINWWGVDIENRGCRKGQLVMARYNDIGSYNPSNVFKTTCEENVREMRLKTKGNGRPAGSYYHSEETKLKMKISHIKRYQQLEEIV